MVALLEELTAGTSYWNPTCSRIEGTPFWEICFSYHWPASIDVERFWCTSTDDPEPPPPDPGPPPPGFPGDFEGDPSVQVFGEGGAPFCVYAGLYGGGVFDPGLGLWGGWRYTLSVTGEPDALLELYPVGFGGGNTLWQLESSAGGGPVSVLNTTMGDGSWPIFNPPPTAWSPCAASNVALIFFGF